MSQIIVKCSANCDRADNSKKRSNFRYQHNNEPVSTAVNERVGQTTEEVTIDPLSNGEQITVTNTAIVNSSEPATRKYSNGGFRFESIAAEEDRVEKWLEHQNIEQRISSAAPSTSDLQAQLDYFIDLSKVKIPNGIYSNPAIASNEPLIDLSLQLEKIPNEKVTGLISSQKISRMFYQTYHHRLAAMVGGIIIH